MPYDPGIPSQSIVMGEVFGLLYGQTTNTRFHFLHEDTNPVATHSNFVARLEADRLLPLAAQLSQDFSFTGVRVHHYNAAGEELAWTEWGLAITGSIVEESVPPSVAWVVKKRTGAPGRAERGRWYLPGLPQSSHDNGVVTTTQRAALATAVADWDQIMLEGTTEFTPMLVRHALDGSVITSKVIVAADPSWILRNQRRRQIGVGI